MIFVHISKTGGTSIARAIGQPWTVHPTAAEIRARVGGHVWSSKPSFAVVRNPWDRTVSEFHYRLDHGRISRNISFEEWISRTLVEKDPAFWDGDRWFMPQMRWISEPSDSSIMIVDEVGRFETLDEDFQRFCRVHGIDARLPHLNASQRDPSTYRNFYSSPTRQIVAEWFAEDIAAFEYRF
jgi:hypothetical protein